MAELVVLKGSFANLNNIPIKEGQLIFTTDEDNRLIFLDTDDSTRVQITSPAIENTDTIILDAGGAPVQQQEVKIYGY